MFKNDILIRRIPLFYKWITYFFDFSSPSSSSSTAAFHPILVASFLPSSSTSMLTHSLAFLPTSLAGTFHRDAGDWGLGVEMFEIS